MSPSGKFVIGLAIGMIGGAGLSIGFNSASSSVSPTAAAVVEPPTVVQVEPWFEDGEIRISTTVILPRGLESDDGTAVFEYELGGMGPSLQGRDDIDPQGDVVVVPERWLLTTVSGAQVEATTSFGAESVRFELAEPDDAIDTITLVGWRVASSLSEPVGLPIAKSASASFRGGTVTVETVLEQTVSTIVQLDIVSSGDDWHRPFLLPTDPHWRWSGRQSGGIQLIWEGENAPSTLSLEDVSVEWRPMSGEVIVFDRADQQ